MHSSIHPARSTLPQARAQLSLTLNTATQRNASVLDIKATVGKEAITKREQFTMVVHFHSRKGAAKAPPLRTKAQTPEYRTRS